MLVERVRVVVVFTVEFGQGNSGQYKTQTMQTADCADCADRADCAD